MKRVTALFLAVVLVFSMTATAFAASVSHSADKTSVSAGSDVVVTLTLDETIEGVTSFQYWLYFNSELFVLKSSTKGTAHTEMDIGALGTDKKTGKNYYSVGVIDKASSDEGLTINAGTIYTLVFTAKEDMTEEQSAAFELVCKGVYTPSWSTINVPVTATELTVQVTPAPAEEKYQVSISDTITNGTVTTDKSTAAAEEIVTLTATPDAGYMLKSLTVLQGETPVALTGNTFKMPEGDVTVSAEFQERTVSASRTEEIKNEAGETETQIIKNFVSAVIGEPVTVSVGEGEDAVEVVIPQTIITFPETAGTITLTYPKNILKLFDAVTFAADAQSTKYAELTSQNGESITAPATVDGDNVVLSIATDTLEDGTYTVTGSNDQPLEALTFRAIEGGYYYATSADTAPGDNGTVEVSVKVTGHSDNLTTYNAYDLSLTFSDNLELAKDADEYIYSGAVKNDGGSLTVNGNTVRIVGAGENKNVGTAVATLTFKVKEGATGLSQVKVTEAKASASKDAIKDAPAASAVHAADDAGADETPDTTVIAAKYTLTYDKKIFQVTGEAIHDGSITFEYLDNNPAHYNHETLTVKNGTETITNLTPVDGKYTIAPVQGNVEINVDPMFYDVAITAENAKVTVVDEIQSGKAAYGVDYVFTAEAADGFTIDGVPVYKIGETGTVKDCAFNVEDRQYSVPGTEIEDKVFITVNTKEADPEDKIEVSFDGNGKDLVVGGPNLSVPANEELKVTLKDKKADHIYSVRVADTKIPMNEDGTFTIPASLLQNGMKITVLEAKLVVNVVNYFNVNNKSMFLVKAKATAVDGENSFDLDLAYGKVAENKFVPMYYSGKYTVTEQITAENGTVTEVASKPGAYSWLVFTTKELPGADEIKAAAMSTIVENTAAMTEEQKAAQTIAYGNDVNDSGKVDVNDAQLVYDMYNAQYTEFTKDLTMKKFLEADVSDVTGENGSQLNTNDVIVIITSIVSKAAAN